MFNFQVLANKIVIELSSLMDQSVIVTDKNGFIIASTDASRINMYHEGAFIAMKSRQELHMTVDMCKTLKGVRPGMVMPIVISDSSIGVIGITGKPSEVEKYAKLVRKVVELFITDFMLREERERSFRDVEFFILDLFTKETPINSIEERGKLLNIDMTIYSRVCIIQTFRPLEISEIENILRIQSLHPEIKIIRWGMEKIVLLLPEINKSELQRGLENLSVKLTKMVKHQVNIGIGEQKEFYQLKDSFHQAEVAITFANGQSKIIFEEDLKLELLYYLIPSKTRDEFLRRTITPILESEDLLYTLAVWLRMKGTLQEIADELHIHKNTLKYRLQKVEQLLNVDFSDKNDLALIYTAIGLYTNK
ncbi:sugar diacid recognition domain-containing protein [Paenisporosarcina sp. TG20]|uniref:CdaR family transcriptional regulator n=1 Tax=Paenisporosarcina sp. TG20 TaxID=1211706 RepID=UPI0002F6C267|nr:sugar diacid recognition domain-containing protein [Paenisporosarcina sp. TG20]